MGRKGGGPIEGGGPKRGRQDRAEGRGSRANRGRRGERDGAPGAKADAERPTMHGVLGITRTTRTPLVAAFAASESVASVTPGEPGPRPLVERLLEGSDPWSLAATLSFVLLEPILELVISLSRIAGPKGARALPSPPTPGGTLAPAQMETRRWLLDSVPSSSANTWGRGNGSVGTRHGRGGRTVPTTLGFTARITMSDLAATSLLPVQMLICGRWDVARSCQKQAGVEKNRGGSSGRLLP